MQRRSLLSATDTCSAFPVVPMPFIWFALLPPTRPHACTRTPPTTRPPSPHPTLSEPTPHWRLRAQPGPHG